MQGKKNISVVFIALSLFIAKSAHAVCPVCTVAVGAGLGFSRWIGIDDSITGVWIGGLSVSLIAWTINWLDGKNIRFLGRKIVVAIGYYALIAGPLWWKGIIGNPQNTLCGVDKLLFGIILGSALFVLGVVFHNNLRRRNEGKSHFKGQKIAAALFPLIIASIILYFTC